MIEQVMREERNRDVESRNSKGAGDVAKIKEARKAMGDQMKAKDESGSGTSSRTKNTSESSGAAMLKNNDIVSGNRLFDKAWDDSFKSLMTNQGDL